MCGLAHFFEDEGLSTVIVALVREHVEAMQPPRALWVPFELGRPFGAPDEPGLQTRILRAALGLMDKSESGPVIEDFQEETPYPQGDAEWAPPDVSTTQDLSSEMNLVRPFWERARQRRHGSTFGVSDLSPEQAVEYVSSYLSENPMKNPRGMGQVSRARFAVDDIKCFYLEAAVAGGGHPSTQQLNDWFWQQTCAGAMIRDFQEALSTSEDRNLELIAGSLVPAERTNQFQSTSGR